MAVLLLHNHLLLLILPDPLLACTCFGNSATESTFGLGLYDWDSDMREAALASIGRLLVGQPIPGYLWVSLRKRRARRLRLKRVAFWLGVTALRC